MAENSKRALRLGLLSVVIGANAVLMANPAEGQRPGINGCYGGGTNPCYCGKDMKFPYCSSDAQCYQIFPGYCKIHPQ